MGAGAARGWAHLGVIRTLHEAGIRPDLVCGTSVGALVGAALACGRIDELERWIRRLGNFGLLGLIDTGFSTGGFIAGAKLMGAFGRHIADCEIEDLDIPFAAVATDIESGREVWLKRGPLTTAVRASIAVPGVFAPVLIDGRWLVDGGLVNPVPVSTARALGADLVIAVNVNERMVLPGGRRRYALPDADETDDGFWDRLRQRWNGDAPQAPPSPSPGIFGVSADALNIMQNRVMRARLAGDPADFLLSPRVGHIGLFEFERADEAIEEGHRAAQLHLGEIERLLVP